ncbi:hypothetical protein ACB098_12G026700 [Castanea mollissima]
MNCTYILLLSVIQLTDEVPNTEEICTPYVTRESRDPSPLVVEIFPSTSCNVRTNQAQGKAIRLQAFLATIKESAKQEEAN